MLVLGQVASKVIAAGWHGVAPCLALWHQDAGPTLVSASGHASYGDERTRTHGEAHVNAHAYAHDKYATLALSFGWRGKILSLGRDEEG